MVFIISRTILPKALADMYPSYHKNSNKRPCSNNRPPPILTQKSVLFAFWGHFPKKTEPLINVQCKVLKKRSYLMQQASKFVPLSWQKKTSKNVCCRHLGYRNRKYYDTKAVHVLAPNSSSTEHVLFSWSKYSNILCSLIMTKNNFEKRMFSPSWLPEDFVCLCWGLTSQSTNFQSCRDGAIASWVINQYFRGVKCLAQGHNTAAVGFEPPTSRSGVRHSTTEPPRSPEEEVD